MHRITAKRAILHGTMEEGPYRLATPIGGPTSQTTRMKRIVSITTAQRVHGMTSTVETYMVEFAKTNPLINSTQSLHHVHELFSDIELRNKLLSLVYTLITSKVLCVKCTVRSICISIFPCIFTGLFFKIYIFQIILYFKLVSVIEKETINKGFENPY